MQITLRPQWDSPGEDFHHRWEGLVAVDHARWLLRSDCLEQLRLARDELGARAVRAPGWLDDDLRVLGPDPKSFSAAAAEPRPNWQLVDSVIDRIEDLELQPLLTTCFTPAPLAPEAPRDRLGRVVAPPQDLGAWSELVTGLLRHLADRYGHEALRRWPIELWHQPERPEHWSGDQDGFFALWDATWRAVKAVDEELVMAGPSTSGGAWLATLIDHGRNHDTPADLISLQLANDRAGDDPVAPLAAAELIAGTRARLHEFGYDGPVAWTGWTRSSRPSDVVRESAYEAAWICLTMAEASQQAEHFAYDCLSDIADRAGYGAETFHGGPGLLNLQGLRKPAWQAFRLLRRLGTRRVTVDGPDLKPHRNAICTVDGDARRALVYNLEVDPAREGDTAAVVVDLPAGCTAVSAWRIDAATNNVLARWRAMGAPATLSRDQRNELRAKDDLVAVPEEQLLLAEGRLRTALASPGVLLLEFR